MERNGMRLLLHATPGGSEVTCSAMVTARKEKCFICEAEPSFDRRQCWLEHIKVLYSSAKRRPD